MYINYQVFIYTLGYVQNANVLILDMIRYMLLNLYLGWLYYNILYIYIHV